ncbi:ribbon-helix-helix domain-containing protein [Patescibacteria group bacterium]|nr:ribbon-helix-helix domain-containing protein [Patescibacteria group bacterium]MBU4512174.1 ribbon-helix-helix domain-containing protein [Patescibacteria group bacterium]MCG2692740.1 ribbon-helix-helix domain-containing protein [Candidatus Parcubacteria bacterium]
MAIVNFSIPTTLEKRVGQTIREKGFSSKAEFFRYAAIYFIDVVDDSAISEDERIKYLSDAITREVIKKFHNKKIPPVEEQLADI